jgi:CRISPR-associated protein Cas2
LIVFIVERATPALRGQLTRWMLEVHAGVFVGKLSTRVREKLWMLIKTRNTKGGSLLLARANNEQGFVVESDGDTSRHVVDFDGLWLVRKPMQEPTTARRRNRRARAPTPPATEAG